MSIETRSRKRKSGDDVVNSPKKAKTAKSADKPAPLKSALKKSNADEKPAKATKPSKVASTASSKIAAKSQKVPEAAAQKIEPEAEVEELEDGAELTADQTAALLAGFSSDEDDDDEPADEGIELSKLPAAPTAASAALAKAQQSTTDAETTPGVIYISRIPHGFYEKQMLAYFSQFGDITHLRLARNRKTAASRHFAFIEFASAAVAEIAAKTMDKYLLFNHILQARVVPRDQINETLWKGGVKRGKVRPRNRIEGTKLRQGMVREGWDKRVDRENTRRTQKQEKLAELGYDFQMPTVKSVSAVPVKPKAIADAPETSVVVAEVVEAVEEAPEAIVGKVGEEDAAEQPSAVSKVTVIEKTTKKRGKTGGAAPKKKVKV